MLVGRGETGHTESRGGRLQQGTQYAPCLGALYALLFSEQSPYSGIFFFRLCYFVSIQAHTYVQVHTQRPEVNDRCHFLLGPIRLVFRDGDLGITN